MKKTLVLNIEYLDMKTIKKADEEKSRKKLFKDAVKAFKIEMCGKESAFKITKEILESGEIVIEFDDDAWGDLHEDGVYAALIKSEVVNTIDSYVYDAKLTPKIDPEKDINDLKDHLSKYSK